MGRKIISERPYSSTSVLLGYAEQLSHTWSWQEIQAALATHPKIGERQAKKQLNAKEQNFSAQEQAGISLDEQTQQALLQGNIEYEQKFGFIFLIKAAGLSSDEILKKLHQRLQNNLAIEKQLYMSNSLQLLYYVYLRKYKHDQHSYFRYEFR